MAKYEFGICLEPVHGSGETRDGKELIGETAFLMAMGPSGERFHTGFSRDLSEFDYDFDGYAVVSTREDAPQRIQELRKIQVDLEQGIRPIDPDLWIELDPQMGTAAWEDFMVRLGQFEGDGW